VSKSIASANSASSQSPMSVCATRIACSRKQSNCFWSLLFWKLQHYLRWWRRYHHTTVPMTAVAVRTIDVVVNTDDDCSFFAVVVATSAARSMGSPQCLVMPLTWPAPTTPTTTACLLQQMSSELHRYMSRSVSNGTSADGIDSLSSSTSLSSTSVLVSESINSLVICQSVKRTCL